MRRPSRPTVILDEAAAPQGEHVPTGVDDPILQVRTLKAEIDTPAGVVHAVDGVSFGLGAGESLGIVGESGSGKTMLVRSLMGLLPRSARIDAESEITFDGRDVVRLPRAVAVQELWGVGIAMIFQNPMTSLNPVRKIGNQLAGPMMRHLGISRREATARSLELMDRVGIPDPSRRIRQYPHEFSGGMRQRIMIAIAISCEPTLLIADEPTTALDVTVQKEVLDLIGQLQRERGMSLILVSHDLNVIAGRTDRVAVMYAGRLVEVSPTRLLFSEPSHPYTSALMRCAPQVGDLSQSVLPTISGQPPNGLGPRTGCLFAPRCDRVADRCRAETPELGEVSGGHLVRCHYPLTR